MKLPNSRKLRTMTALGVLLAAMSTGCLTLCEIFFGAEPEDGDDIFVTASAGSSANNAFALFNFLSRVALCNGDLSQATTVGGGNTIVPAGVYLRTSRDLRGAEPTATVDLVTSSNTPEGVYTLQYRETAPGTYVIGTLYLTIEHEDLPVQACMAVYGSEEFIVVGQSASFYGCCSFSSDIEDPIVQYKWWWDYNGNPSSSPSQTTTTCMTTHTYNTAGPRTTRLVVRTQSGLEAADLYEINVQSRGGPAQ